ncbi:MAG TPA: hypothetical protein PK530_00675 [Anaerolineales bacterium]|nr:hypothetical protein [Anaerolineales bacterium]
MTLRTGMTDIVKSIRQLGEAGTADYALAGETYWTDEHLQALADRHRQWFHAVNLTMESQQIGGTTRYYRYRFPDTLRPDWYGIEGTAGGTAAFRVDDSLGNLIAGTLYTFHPDALDVVFAADQAGSARYWTGFAYDLPAIAAELWTRKAAHAWSAINFSADGHRFDRGALQAHCLEMAKTFQRAKGTRAVKMHRGDVC